MDKTILYLLYYDIFYYFMHRLLHTKMFYLIHKIHHKKQIPDYFDFYNVDIVEIPITSVGLGVALYLHEIYVYQLLCSILIINVRGVMAHETNCVFLLGDHHLDHHKYIYCNYGEYWLDYIFDTARGRQARINQE